MGLYAYEIKIIAALAKNLKRGFTVLSLGHPDILATPDELQPIIRKRIGTDNQGVFDTRLKAPKPDIVGSAKLLFEALGGRLHVIDYRNVYGVDTVVDLNEPLSLGREFDLVIDPGTTEHVFMAGQCMVNIAKHVKEHGYVYHMVPLLGWNHGFWNFSPLVFDQFYNENGFKIIDLMIDRLGAMDPAPLGKFKRNNSGQKLNLMCTAQRTTYQEIKIPRLQAKYE